jgi:pyruvate formate lyase activating enzyme
MYKLKSLPPTPAKTLEKARETAMDAGLHFVYIGNVPGNEGEHTHCPQCRKTVIERVGYRIRANHLKGGACAFCGEAIPGIWAT